MTSTSHICQCASWTLAVYLPLLHLLLIRTCHQPGLVPLADEGLLQSPAGKFLILLIM